MTMTTDTNTELHDLLYRAAYDLAGQKVGTVTNVYIDDMSGDPTWLEITTGWLAPQVSFAPLAGGYLVGEDVVVAYPKGTVKEAPTVDADGPLSYDDEFELYAYYVDQHQVRCRCQTCCPADAPDPRS